jgi:purine-binding chemotaxis protein CheW
MRPVDDLALAPKPARLFYTFRVHGRLYGLDLAQVREVSTQVDCTPVPQTPPLVRGMANLRSRIFLVLDSGAAVRGEPSQRTPESRLIVLQERVAASLALLVDRGGEVVRVPANEIEDTPRPELANSPGDSQTGPVVALCKLEGELMMLIDPLRIIAALETAIR